MEKRIGSILILVENKTSVQLVNEIISLHAEAIIGRQGIPMRDKGISIISLVIEATVEEFNALSGQLGKIRDVQVKSVISKLLMD
jgi:putative iron-only hydrogenase system regulator